MIVGNNRKEPMKRIDICYLAGKCSGKEYNYYMEQYKILKERFSKLKKKELIDMLIKSTFDIRNLLKSQSISLGETLYLQATCSQLEKPYIRVRKDIYSDYLKMIGDRKDKKEK